MLMLEYEVVIVAYYHSTYDYCLDKFQIGKKVCRPNPKSGTPTLLLPITIIILIVLGEVRSTHKFYPLLGSDLHKVPKKSDYLYKVPEKIRLHEGDLGSGEAIIFIFFYFSFFIFLNNWL